MNIREGHICNAANYKRGRSGPVKYLVIHYTSNDGDTAEANVNYFARERVGASAHYFVDENSVWTSVPEEDTAWHCGTSGTYYHKECRNANSIGIELCTRIGAGGSYFKDQTVENAAELAKQLMQQYDIPAERVVRHYDVTHKNCPEPFVKHPEQWEAFKAKLYKASYWAEPYLDRLIKEGVVQDPSFWKEYNAYLPVGIAVIVIDRLSGGIWPSEEADPLVHPSQPDIISLCGKRIIENPGLWLDKVDELLSKAMCLALVDKATGGMEKQYQCRETDHWGRNHLDSLCDKKIITAPHEWDDDFEAPVNREKFMELVCKAFL